MTVQAAGAHRPAWMVVLVRGLGVATAALLAIDAYVHFDDALYDIGAGAAVTQGSLFRAQASIAVLVAIALLVRPHWIVWTIAALVAASAAAAVYLYTSVDVGRLGPLPDMYDPTWALPGKRASALAETVAQDCPPPGWWSPCVPEEHRRSPTMGMSSSASHRRLPSPCTGHRHHLDSARRPDTAPSTGAASQVERASCPEPWLGGSNPFDTSAPMHSRSRTSAPFQATATSRFS